MSTLLSVPGLQKVRLQISSLTENWVKRILSLMEICPSLQEIRYEDVKNKMLFVLECTFLFSRLRLKM